MIRITRGVSGDCPGSCACPELCEAELCRQVELETTAPALRASSVCLASGPSPAGTRFPGGMSPASVRCWATGGRAGLVQQPRRTSTHLRWASGGLPQCPQPLSGAWGFTAPIPAWKAGSWARRALLLGGLPVRNGFAWALLVSLPLGPPVLPGGALALWAGTVYGARLCREGGGGGPGTAVLNHQAGDVGSAQTVAGFVPSSLVPH